jgi:pimeloyl-ACP methyl ester carboxylesterase
VTNGRRVHSVQVPGGALAVEDLFGSTEPVLAIHGISSQRRLWNWLRDSAPEVRLIAPDLRGRADSFAVTGTSSLMQHADDMVAVLDALALDKVHVCGMSMGGFVAVELAVRHPERIHNLVLVDGGPPMTPPAGLTRELLPMVFKDRLDRLEHEWTSVEEYAAFFTTSTAPLLDPADPLLLDYLQHDLESGRVRLSGEALLADAADVFFSPDRLGEVSVPMRLLHAEWSIGVGSAPGYSKDVVDAIRDRFVSVSFIEGVDHAGSIMTVRGARATAEQLRAALG